MKYSITAFILALMLMAPACGGDQAEEVVTDQPEGTVNEAVDTPDDSGETDVVETTDDSGETDAVEPEAVIPAEAMAEVESTNGAYTNLEVPIDWSSIGTQQVLVDKLTSGSICRIFIANFNTDEGLNSIAREPGQGIIKFTLDLPPDSDPLVGTYDLTCTGSEFTGEASVMVTGGSTIQFATSSMTDGVLEITSVTDDMVTGTFQAQDNWTTISGAFQAEIQ